ncbi:30S ribosomal protein S27ae [Candidatus Micrarchaeota archaeon]|nr:30S ribosomal protein S27ae [Candidatus Micrarchaeota archaeon]
MGSKKRKVRVRGKKSKKKKEKKIKPYKKPRFCPKCGPGVHLAEHKDRWSCGKCGYYEKK